jgi:hypothetical protein
MIKYYPFRTYKTKNSEMSSLKKQYIYIYIYIYVYNECNSETRMPTPHYNTCHWKWKMLAYLILMQNRLKYFLPLKKKRQRKKQSAFYTSNILWLLRHWFRINIHSYTKHPINVTYEIINNPVRYVNRTLFASVAFSEIHTPNINKLNEDSLAILTRILL